MVIVTDFKKVQNSNNEEFCMLVLTGEPELVTSKSSGRQYFTARTCNIASTFSEMVCKQMIGKQMPGSIVRKECEPYDYTPPNSDEVLTLDFTYVYDPSQASMEEAVIMDSL